MGRAPCCDKANVKRGPWSPEEDSKLRDYINKNGTGGNWIALPQKAGLRRCGKSCRLRWLNYLRPNIKHGEFSDDEDKIIINLFANIGSRWSIIAGQLPGRTDNDIKNYWNTKLKKKLMAIINNNNSNNNQLIKPSSIIQFIHQPCSSTLITQSPNYFHHNQEQQQGSQISPSSNILPTMVPQEISSLFGHEHSHSPARYSTNNLLCGVLEEEEEEEEEEEKVNIVSFSNGNSWGSSSTTTTEDHSQHPQKSSVLDDHYGTLEEINQLISSNNNNKSSSDTTTSSFGNNQEAVLYYYY